MAGTINFTHRLKLLLINNQNSEKKDGLVSYRKPTLTLSDNLVLWLVNES